MKSNALKMRRVSRLGFLVAILSIGQLGYAQMKLTENRREDPAKAEFVYTDVEHFVEAYRQLKPGVDTVAIMQTMYLDKQTPGLRMFIEKYGLNAKNLTAAIGRRPHVYARLGGLLDVLYQQEPEYRRAYVDLKRMIPDASFPPTFFLVATYRGIASGSIEGTINSIEKETEESLKGDFVATLVHEMTHLQQLRVLGEKYFTVFNEEKTLLALTIREGAAEFFAERVTGGDTFKAPARDYLIAHEQDLWRRYKQDMMGRDTKGWMWGHPADDAQPEDIAYVLGARIVETYYENSKNKTKAVGEILGVTDYPEFLRKSGYEERLFRESRQQ